MEEEIIDEEIVQPDIPEEPKLSIEDMALVVTYVYKNVPLIYEWMPVSKAYEKVKEITGEQDAIQIKQ